MDRNRRVKMPGTDWGSEIAHAFGIVIKIILKILSYIVNILLTVLLIGLITGLVVGSTFAYYVKNYIDADIEEFDMITNSQSKTTKIYYYDWTDRENQIGVPVEIEDQRLHGSENRMWVSITEMPEYLYHAFIAIEDKRFYEHNGVDFLRTAKAAVNYFFKGEDSYGASTITQQLIKNITGDDDVTIQRKIQEIMRALKLNEKKDKSEILEMYLNIIPLSQGCYGVQAAAYTYFGKDVSELILIECAALAAITQHPIKWDPVINPENNKLRRDLVLKEMLDQGYITQSEFESAYGKDLVLNVQRKNVVENKNSWYTDAVIEEAIELLVQTKGYTEEVASMLIYTGGYQIYTAMDPVVQNVLEEYFGNEENFKFDNVDLLPEASMVVIDPLTGDVLGLVGGREKAGDRVLNRATQSRRSPGSSIKPLSVYAPALEYGLITYGSVYDDTPVNFGNPVYDAAGKLTGYSDPDGYPNNYPATYKGLTTINDAICRSVNTISLKVLENLTLSKSFDFVKNKLHMDSFIEYRQLPGGIGITDMDYSALGLGGMNYGVTVLEMTAAYQIFANKGIYNKPRLVHKILDSENNVIVNNEAEQSIVISEQNATIMTKMLQRVVESGTASKLTVDSIINVAGKTGTTTEDNDRWFIGYTPYYVGGVWFGYDMPMSLSSFSATESPALKIWDNVMKTLHEKIIEEANKSGFGVKSFVDAPGIVTATYCKDSGKLLTDACKADPRGSRAETGYFTADTIPTEKCDRHVLVAYDKSTGGVASPYCPKDKIVYYGLIKETTRSFPKQIIVVDAQYVYRDLPKHILPGASVTDPFFINTLPPNTYVGVSDYNSQFNHYCWTHYNTPPEKPDESEAANDDESANNGNDKENGNGKKDKGDKKGLPEDEILYEDEYFPDE